MIKKDETFFYFTLRFSHLFLALYLFVNLYNEDTDIAD